MSKIESMVEEAKNRRLSREILDVEEKKRKLVIFSLGDHFFCFPGENIKEIIPTPTVSVVPGAPDFIHGIINVRGDIESVLNLHSLLALPEPTSNSGGHITMAESGGIKSGILVDRVHDVLDIEEKQIAPPLSTHGKEIKDFAVGEISLKNKNITLLDLAGIFSRILS
ncbi:MAG: purine-binding chemotaxis protein CheW [Candidatus Riflebacteria bacterium]|nr:purine-binding chemotaxis protein CheW [Candidatus Riflebacteria bacterium]